MFENLNGWEIGALLLIALLIFGERLPKVIADGMRMLRNLRAMATNATGDLSRELGTDIKLEDLNPKTFVRKHLLSEEDQATLTKAVYQAATGLLAVEEARRFLERFTAGPDLIPVATPDGPRFSTAVLLAQERRIVQTARVKAATPMLAPSPQLVGRMVELAGLGGTRLSDEQRVALGWLAAPSGWASLEGWAGTG